MINSSYCDKCKEHLEFCRCNKDLASILKTNLTTKQKKAKEMAIWEVCPDYKENPSDHSLNDHCYTCMPWWERYPRCPYEVDIHLPLPKSGWCKHCRKYHDVKEEV